MSEQSTVMNSIPDIRRYLETPPQKPLEQGEFVRFWQSLNDSEKREFQTTPLR